jgi:hypothetical protein
MVCCNTNYAKLGFKEIHFTFSKHSSVYDKKTFSIIAFLPALLVLMASESAFAAGDAAAGKAYWASKCVKCHGKVLPNDHDAFTDLDTTANRLSFYASDAALITKAGTEGYIIPEGNTDEKAKPGTNSNIPMKPWLGTGKDRLGEGNIPTQLALDIAAYFASFYDAPSSPKITDVAAKDASAVVGFTTPKSDLTVTSYSVVSDPGNITSTGPAGPITITGLANGTSYKFTVSAISNAGKSRPSSSSDSVTPIASAAGPAVIPPAAPVAPLLQAPVPQSSVAKATVVTAVVPQSSVAKATVLTAVVPQSSVAKATVLTAVVPQSSVAKATVNQPALPTTNAPKAVGLQTTSPQSAVSQTALPKAK